MRVVAVIQARCGSSRFPGKVLQLLDGRTLLAHVIEHAEKIPGVREVVVATTTDPEDDAIVARCRGAGARWVRAPRARDGGPNDVLARFVMAADVSHADVIIRLTADCPLLDPAVAGEVLRFLLAEPGRGYASNDHPATFYDGCLAPRSLVRMADGHWKRIADLVRRRSTEEVTTFDTSTNQLTSRRIYGWHRNTFPSRDWRRIEFVHQKRSRFGVQGAIFTPDHRVWTEAGWTAVEDLKPGVGVAVEERALSSREESVVLGTLLGDGYLSRRSLASLVVVHAVRQREYAEFKARLLVRLNPKWRKPGRGGFPGSSANIRFETDWRISLAEIGAEVYQGGRKRVTRAILNHLSALGLAIWYMDDGMLQLKGHSPSARLSTYAFSRRENQVIVRWLQARFGIEASVDLACVRSRTRSFIRLSAEGSRRLFSQIAQYVPPTMQYKLSPEYRDQFIDCSERAPVDVGPYFAEVRRVYRVRSVRRAYRWRGQALTRENIGASSYCIDVEGTHNFVTKSGIAHNCDAEVFTREMLAWADEETRDRLERSHVTPAMWRRWPPLNLLAPGGRDDSAVKLSVDREEDLARVERVYLAMRRATRAAYGWRDVLTAYAREYPAAYFRVHPDPVAERAFKIYGRKDRSAALRDAFSEGARAAAAARRVARARRAALEAAADYRADPRPAPRCPHSSEDPAARPLRHAWLLGWEDATELVLSWSESACASS